MSSATVEPEADMGKMSNEQWNERLREIRQEMVDEKRALPQGYLAALPFAINAARERGYALAQHGTMGRDLDLVAVPWTDEACSAEELAVAIAAATGTNITEHDQNPTHKPHGRLCWSLHFHLVSQDKWAIPTGCYIDLAVMPRAADQLRQHEQAVRASIADEFLPVLAYDAGNGVRIEAARQIDGRMLWKAKDQFGDVLNKSGAWEWEPMPSGREDDFLARCRFDTPQEALAALRSAAVVVATGETK